MLQTDIFILSEAPTNYRQTDIEIKEYKFTCQCIQFQMGLTGNLHYTHICNFQ